MKFSAFQLYVTSTAWGGGGGGVNIYDALVQYSGTLFKATIKTKQKWS